MQTICPVQLQRFLFRTTLDKHLGLLGWYQCQKLYIYMGVFEIEVLGVFQTMNISRYQFSDTPVTPDYISNDIPIVTPFIDTFPIHFHIGKLSDPLSEQPHSMIPVICPCPLHHAFWGVFKGWAGDGTSYSWWYIYIIFIYHHEYPIQWPFSWLVSIGPTIFINMSSLHIL